MASPTPESPWQDFLASIAITMALVVFNVLWIDKSSIGQRVERATYEALQGRLTSKFTDQNFPAVIVDIGNLTRTEQDEGEPVTPREKLLDLVKALAAYEPSALAIDIDFSPDENNEEGVARRRVYAPDDILFFKACDLLGQDRKDQTGAIRKGTPIFLGVSRTVAEDPDRWLPSVPAGLAVALVKPRDIKRMTGWIRNEAGAESSAENHAEVRPHCSMEGPSLSMALALKQGISPHVRKCYVRLLEAVKVIERTGEERLEPGHYVIEEFLVDFSPVDFLSRPQEQLMVPKGAFNEPQIMAEFVKSWRDRIRGKLVVIGTASKGRAVDYFKVPDRDQPVPGVIVQASAVYTLTNAPLYELTSWFRPLLDIWLSTLVFGTLLGIRLHYRRTGQPIAVHRLQGILIFVGIALIAWAAVLVNATRVLWDDFLLVIAALLLHSYVERLWAWGRTTIPSLILKPPGPGEQG